MSIFDLFKKTSTNKKNNQALESVLSSLEKNEIIMETDSSADKTLTCESKIGGRPWLPRDFEWPIFENKDEGESYPLSFLCQINLSEVKEYDTDRLLPDHGMLYFFYECESFCWGFDPEDKGSARVIYFENIEDFALIDLPEGISDEHVVPEMAVRFTAQKSYPKYEELEIHSNIDCDWEEYDDNLEKMGVDLESENHKLLGYADIIQNEMLTECERVTRGIYCGDAESYKNTSEDEEVIIRRHASDWILLLQLSTLEKDDWELMWGDCGMLYFYIKKQDLADNRFENAWFSLQCG